jgi:hypothetical protein
VLVAQVDPQAAQVVKVVLAVLVQLVVLEVLEATEEILVMQDKMVKSVIHFGNHKVVIQEHQAVVMVVLVAIGHLDQEQVLAVVAAVDPQ